MLILAASSVEETLKAAQAPGLLQLFILHHILLLCPPLLMTALLHIRICFCPTITTQTTTLRQDVELELWIPELLLLLQLEAVVVQRKLSLSFARVEAAS
jgi:hypothetical protein